MRATTALLISFSLAFNPSTYAGTADDLKSYANKAMFWKDASLKRIGFAETFPKPLYKKSYFGFVLTGVTIVGAGAFTYFTAGAGAPVAAAGTSTVATWVAGGGAGSYMAGLSTVGGWFGGNAILGASILNGISIGVIGGGTTAFASLPAIGKAGVMASVTASALDGVALIAGEKAETKNLSYRVRLVLPKHLGSRAVRKLANDFLELELKMQEADGKGNESNYKKFAKEKTLLVNFGVGMVKDVMKSQSASNEDCLVLAVFSKNIGDSESFEKLIDRINADKLDSAGYLDYLKGVASIEKGNVKSADNFLRRSIRLNPYAIEAPLLLVNILGRDFKNKEEEILSIARNASRDFDADKYEPGYSLVSMYYRIGTLYLLGKQYEQAKRHYESALDELSLIQKHLGNKHIPNMIKLGIANAMYGQGNKKDADELFSKLIEATKDQNAKVFFKRQYAGTIDKAPRT